MEERNQTRKGELLSQMLEMEKNGASFYLDGLPSSPQRLVDTFVRENALYMADYVLNDKGVVEEVRCDKLTDL